MRKLFIPLVAASLLAATAAHAQFGGGGGGGGGAGGGGGGGHGHGGGRGQQPSSSSAAPTPQAPVRPSTPTDQVDIIGVVEAIGPEPDRVTIAYDAVDALNWPAGAMPFVVAKTEFLKSVSVGERVRFHLDSQQISFIEAYVPKPPSAFGASGYR